MSETEWPPDYTDVFAFRQKQVLLFRKNPELLLGAKEYYRKNPTEFINHWCDTYDPRNAGKGGKMTRMPLCLFDKQNELVEFLSSMIEESENGLIEKTRDMGATWVCCAFSVWLWLFYSGSSVGWGSRKEQLVDKLGDPDSIFEKMRMIVTGLPPEFIPKGLNPKEHLTFMKMINPENGSTITGEGGDNIGRGGRKLIYFKDESAHYERAEKIEAALADNTNVQIDISSVNGLGNVFHRKRESGVEWARGNTAKSATNVFIMNWSDHPYKTKEWYNARKKKAEANGLLHLFAQEVDRSYSAAIQGTIIPSEWVTAAIDAHIELDFDGSGSWVSALDVADGGGDKNAFAARKGVILKDLQEWYERDTGVSARKVADLCSSKGSIFVQYDCIGVGAGVKAESNRLLDEGYMPKDVVFVAWDAGASPQNKEKPVIKGDKESPLNGDFYTNLKAQGWWELRRRFEKTYKAIHNFENYLEDELISISSDLPFLRSLQKELSQPTAGKNSRMKLLVNKTPDGTMSPNLADAVMMAYWPITSKVKKARVICKPRLLS